MTEKLYDKDSHIKEFSATVLSCEKSGENYAVTLNKTAFFPEGGGQESDRGDIGGAAVRKATLNNYGDILRKKSQNRFGGSHQKVERSNSGNSRRSRKFRRG